MHAWHALHSTPLLQAPVHLMVSPVSERDPPWWPTWLCHPLPLTFGAALLTLHTAERSAGLDCDTDKAAPEVRSAGRRSGQQVWKHVISSAAQCSMHGAHGARSRYDATTLLGGVHLKGHKAVHLRHCIKLQICIDSIPGRTSG